MLARENNVTKNREARTEPSFKPVGILVDFVPSLTLGATQAIANRAEL
jgi:hypothetical protein